MELTPKQQVLELISKSKRVLILTHKNPGGDGVAAALSLSLALERQGKETFVALPEMLPSTYKFLPNQDKITIDFSGTRDFVISLDLTQTQVDKLGYKIEDKKLNVIITPKGGTFSEKDVSFSQGEYKFDLIVVVDSTDLDQLGKLFEDNAEIFYERPVINIDHHAANDNFGKVNLIDLTATSTCEILVSLIESLGAEKSLIDEDIATALLAGIIADTDSFQNASTTPKSFTVAAQLVAAGARQQEIVSALFRTKPISTLRLWGRILAGIREDAKYRMLWSYCLARDLEQTRASENDIEGAMDELMSTVPEAEVAMILAEAPGGVRVFIRTHRGIDANAIAEIFNATGGPNSAQILLEGKRMGEAEKEILRKIREFQAERLGIEYNGTTRVSQLPVQAKGSSPVEVKEKREDRDDKGEKERKRDDKGKPGGRILTQYPKYPHDK